MSDLRTRRMQDRAHEDEHVVVAHDRYILGTGREYDMDALPPGPFNDWHDNVASLLEPVNRQTLAARWCLAGMVGMWVLCWQLGAFATPADAPCVVAPSTGQP